MANEPNVDVPVAPAAPPVAAVETPKPEALPPSPASVEKPVEAPPPKESPPAGTTLLNQAPVVAPVEKPKEPAPAVPKEAAPAVKPEAPKPESPPDKAPAGPPVIYETFKLPEGLAPDQKEMTSFTDILRDGKASQEMGQRLVDLYVGEVQRFHAHQREQWQKTLDQWKDDAVNDPQMGGNRFNTVLTRSVGVLNEFATPGLREMLDVTGLGNHVEMFRFLNKIADFVGEPRPKDLSGAKPPNIKPTRAERRYGKGNGAQPTG